LACPEVIRFSQKDAAAEVFASDIRSDEGKVTMHVKVHGVKGYDDFEEIFTPGTFGTINVENALAAISLALLLGVPVENIKEGLAATSVPGRMEVFRSKDKKITAIVDFAHNELSFDRFFETAKKEFPGKKIISVFGATGTKAVTRRTGMGTSAGKHCAYSILSEDDPGQEDPFEICKEIGACIEAVGGKYEIIVDRDAAIKRAVELADEDTILFLAGRGTVSTQKRGNRNIETGSDKDFLMKYI
jgi:UDP-N-acetylmuramoyl-L-alanyl-D-glutamate--2,6-diaminopimelate ligase